MRTKTLLLTAALSAAGIATSMAQVYSVNAVGYVNTSLVPGFSLVANPLDNKTGNTIKNLFGTGIQGTIPNQTTVYAFNSDTDQFVISSYDDIDLVFGPEPQASFVIPVGGGAFVRNPSATALTVTFVGEVAQGTGANALVNPLPQGFSIKSSMVPQAGTAIALGLTGLQGDSIYEWNPTTQSYIPSSWDDVDNTWLSATPGYQPTFDVGEAFFIFKRAAGEWRREFSVNPPNP